MNTLAQNYVTRPTKAYAAVIISCVVKYGDATYHEITIRTNDGVIHNDIKLYAGMDRPKIGDYLVIDEHGECSHMDPHQFAQYYRTAPSEGVGTDAEGDDVQTRLTNILVDGLKSFGAQGAYILKQWDKERAEVMNKPKPDHLTFGEALEHLRAGKYVSRTWKGDLYLVVLKTDMIPLRRGDTLFQLGLETAIYNLHRDSAVVWSPSQEDMFATDWYVVHKMKGD